MNQKGIFTSTILFLGMAILLGTACSPRLLFTEQNRSHLENQKLDIERVQFYTDKDIVMRRKMESSETKVSNGEIRQIDGDRTQEIRIPRGTPGIVDRVDVGKIWLVFEDRDSCAIRFYKNSYDTYQVDADKWIEKKGAIRYDRESFYLVPPNNDALLMVKKREIYKPEKRSRVAKGVRIDGKGKKKKKVRRKDIKRIEEDEEFDSQPDWDDNTDWDGGQTEPKSDASDQ